MVWASGKDASWSPPCGGVPGMSNWEEALGQTRSRWRDHISALTWEHLRIPQSELVDVAREREIWHPLLKLLAPALNKQLTMVEGGTYI